MERDRTMERLRETDIVEMNLKKLQAKNLDVSGAGLLESDMFVEAPAKKSHESDAEEKSED